MAAPQTFRDLIATNKRNSVLLVVIFVLFNAAVAMVLALASWRYMDPDAVIHLNWGLAIFIGVIAGGDRVSVFAIRLFHRRSIILATSGAREIRHDDDPELFNVVEEMAIAAGLPMPRVYLIDDPAPNAFATGRDPRHAAVAITSGLRQQVTARRTPRRHRP